jgi:hypothetical protein
MGFEPQIRRIVQQDDMPGNEHRQTVGCWLCLCLCVYIYVVSICMHVLLPAAACALLAAYERCREPCAHMWV